MRLRVNASGVSDAVSPEAEQEMASLLEELKRRASSGIEGSAARLSALSREIWGRPELAYQERQAHEALARFFSSSSGGGGGEGEGWKVQRSYKLETAFRAEWEWEWGPGGGGDGDGVPLVLRLGFLCEYDALPGLGHACGHNLIAEVGAGAALGLKAALQSLGPGDPSPSPLLLLREQAQRPAAVKITVLGTPAEEGGAGKAVLIKAGAFDDLDVVFMAHPFQEDLPYKPAMADHQVTVKYFGKASHAAAYPWEGVNALDAAVLAYNNLSVLRQQIKPTWRVHGIIKAGGERPNVIPSFTELEFYLRTPLLKELPILIKKAESCFKAAALATGCQVEIRSDTPEYYNVLQNKSLEQAYVENGKRLGMEFPDKAISSTSLGSTDFGNVSYVVPGIHPYFYIGSDALNHTEQFTVAAGSEEAQQYALRTAKALAMTALDVIFRPGLLQQVQDDFRQTKLEE